MWKKVEKLTKDEMKVLRGLRKAKLYADEDIEEEVVEFIRDNGVNIKSARELGHRRKPDSFHLSLSRRQKRFLLTKNGKHYWDDREVPFHSIYGIIVLEGDMSDINAYVSSILQVLNSIVPWGEVFTGMKIRVSPKQATFRFIDRNGQLTVLRYQIIRGDIYECIDEEE